MELKSRLKEERRNEAKRSPVEAKDVCKYSSGMPLILCVQLSCLSSLSSESLIESLCKWLIFVP